MKRARKMAAMFAATLALFFAAPVVSGVSVSPVDAAMVKMRGIYNGQVGTWYIDTDSGRAFFVPD